MRLESLRASRTPRMSWFTSTTPTLSLPPLVNVCSRVTIFGRFISYREPFLLRILQSLIIIILRFSLAETAHFDSTTTGRKDLDLYLNNVNV